MCMEDIKLGRQLDTNVSNALVSVAGSQVAGTSVNRTRLIFSASDLGATGQIRVWPKRMGTTYTGGICLITGHPTEVVRIEEYGSMICEAWLGATSGGGESLMVTDVSLQKQ
jgi:hypothetical protein